MSKQALKRLNEQFEEIMQTQNGFDVICQNNTIHKEYLDKLELQAFDKINEAIKKEFEWIKWIVAIGAGVFSVMTTQLAKGTFQGEQLTMIKYAISLNALGVIFGAIFLYQDSQMEKGFVRGIEAQKKTILLTGERLYEKAIPSDRGLITRTFKFLCISSLTIAMLIWVYFIWSL